MIAFGDVVPDGIQCQHGQVMRRRLDRCLVYDIQGRGAQRDLLLAQLGMVAQTVLVSRMKMQRPTVSVIGVLGEGGADQTGGEHGDLWRQRGSYRR
jgi:hypothetical protein